MCLPNRLMYLSLLDLLMTESDRTIFFSLQSLPNLPFGKQVLAVYLRLTLDTRSFRLCLLSAKFRDK